MASVARYCCCGDPCGCSTTPNSATIAGIGAGCATLAGNPLAFDLFSPGGSVCEWQWFVSQPVGYAWSTFFRLTYGTGTVSSYNANCTAISITNEWVAEIYHIREDATTFATIEYYQDMEKTTGFSCDPSTGKVSGTHTFALPTCAGLVTAGCLSTTATVTVPA